MLVWGSAYVVTKWVVLEVPPLLFAFLRFAVASTILVALARSRGGPRSLEPLPLGTLALMGLSGVTLFYIGFNVALVYTTVTEGALIQGAIPAATAGLAMVCLGERLSRTRAVGIAVSILGVALILLTVGEATQARDPLLGNLWMLLTVVSWAVYTVLGRSLRAALPLTVTAYSTLLGTLGLAAAAGFELAGHPPPAVSWSSWLAALYLGAGPSALAYLLWNQALRHLDAGQAANFLNLIPVVGVASAALFLGEIPTPGQLVGGSLVVGGVWLSSRDP
jgi:drug/metabolite transporter (DMT)-like permease